MHTLMSSSNVDPFAMIINGFSPWTIGFDRQIQSLQNLEKERISSSYPPYNIIDLKNDKYKIELACAGFKKDDIEIHFKDNVITVSGSKKGAEEDEVYIHRGIAARDFEQKFGVAEDVKIVGASLKDGFLVIDLEREVPEHKKARTITIK